MWNAIIVVESLAIDSVLNEKGEFVTIVRKYGVREERRVGKE